MKKFFLTLAAIFTLSGMFAQIDREVVLIEVATGTWCGWCQSVAKAVDKLHENGDPVAPIEYHSSDAFSNTYSDDRNDNYYKVSLFPTTHFDGSYNEYLGGSNQDLYPTFQGIVNTRMGIQTPFKMEITGTNDGDDYSITVKVTKVGEYSGTDLWVRFALTESHIPYNWFDMFEVNFVERIMVPDATGTSVDFSDDDEVEVELSFTFDNSWDAENCDLVAFIQDDGSKEVLHSTHVMINDLDDGGGGGGGFQAGFYADDTLFCETPAVAQFFDDCSGGDAISWNWYFEGGIPETSLEENPVVTYLEEGSFDVQLIVSDGTDMDTLFVPDYIVVSSTPEVYWEDVPDLCNQGDDPYLLTEGRPEGGVYSGDYVTEGKYFHPTQAGTGDHVVTYTYANESGCENSADYTITVDECTGIGENEAVGLELFPNPTNGLLNINISAEEFNNADLKILNVLGKEVYTKKGLNINGDVSLRVDLSTQPEGVYFVVISGDNQKVVRKVLLNR